VKAGDWRERVVWLYRRTRVRERIRRLFTITSCSPFLSADQQLNQSSLVCSHNCVSKKKREHDCLADKHNKLITIKMRQTKREIISIQNYFNYCASSWPYSSSIIHLSSLERKKIDRLCSLRDYTSASVICTHMHTCISFSPSFFFFHSPLDNECPGHID
jgi:hypothetical protein